MKMDHAVITWHKPHPVRTRNRVSALVMVVIFGVIATGAGLFGQVFLSAAFAIFVLIVVTGLAAPMPLIELSQRQVIVRPKRPLHNPSFVAPAVMTVTTALFMVQVFANRGSDEFARLPYLAGLMTVATVTSVSMR